MKKISPPGLSWLFFFFISSFIFLSCGVKGPLQPPLSLIPPKIEAIKCYQQGTKIVLEWTTPLFYENGVAMSSFPVVEIWVNKVPIEAPSKTSILADLGEILKKSRLLEEINCGENQAPSTWPSSIESRWEYPWSAEKSGQEILIFFLRLKDNQGRKSSFSQPVIIAPIKPPSPPQILKAELAEDRVILSWKYVPRDKDEEINGFNLYKKEKEASTWQRLNPMPFSLHEFEDKEIILGKTYVYAVRSVQVIDSIERESELSESVEILIKDVFPPPPPSGVVFIIGEDRIVLNWEPSLAPDLAGYRIRRRAEDSQIFELLTPEPILRTSYEDLQVEKGKSYYYAITACDQAGNESQPIAIKVRMERER